MTTHVHWETHPHAAALVAELLDGLLAQCPAANRLGDQLAEHTGTRLLDWIDHLAVPGAGEMRSRVESVGFELRGDEAGAAVYVHQRGMFPTLLLTHGSDVRRIAVRVESVADYLFAHGLDDRQIMGPPLGPIRTVDVDFGSPIDLWVVERHGYTGFDADSINSDKTAKVVRHAEAMRLRRRFLDAADAGFDHAMGLIDASVKDIGAARTADVFFAAEREYWESRNAAARVQRARQDMLGMGWANHDHHTYRSSRANFAKLVAAFERMGLVCRERFYAGKEAGWGAQVMEQPEARIVVFADVDLGPDEVTGDFAHQPLGPRDTLGTVGLWCALHGDSFLQAGMHHLECQFDFDAARRQLTAAGIESMKPFTDFEYLRQAFTEGERWPVHPRRIDAALSAGQITPQQAAKFKTDGAIGSHLEVLQRDDGYKGFNQTGINDIIRQTDPRNQRPVGA